MIGTIAALDANSGVARVMDEGGGRELCFTAAEMVDAAQFTAALVGKRVRFDSVAEGSLAFTDANGNQQQAAGLHAGNVRPL